MGALEGSLTFKTYYVDGEPPADFQDDYLGRLNRHFFEPLSPVGEEDRTIGWVPAQDPIAQAFERDHVFFNQYIVFALRIDKWALPAPWIKAMMRKAIAERMPELEAEEAKKQEAEGKMRPKAKLSRAEKAKIKEAVTTDLKHKILPAMKVIDVVWNVSERKLRFWSTSQAVCDEFAEFFEETFGIGLNPDSPFLMAKDLGLSEAKLEDMVEADPWIPAYEEEA